jgi:hypothetical protein
LPRRRIPPGWRPADTAQFVELAYGVAGRWRRVAATLDGVVVGSPIQLMLVPQGTHFGDREDAVGGEA